MSDHSNTNGVLRNTAVAGLATGLSAVSLSRLYAGREDPVVMRLWLSAGVSATGWRGAATRRGVRHRGFGDAHRDDREESQRQRSGKIDSRWLSGENDQ